MAKMFPILLIGLLGLSSLASISASEEATPIVRGNETSRGKRDVLFNDIALPFAARGLGIIECAGFDHVTHVPIFETIYGKGVDFGGNYLCEPTCGGHCIPKNNDLLDAPVSLYYPFGCQCPASRCDHNGPRVTPIVKPFKVFCVKDNRCTCTSMGPRGSHIGYLCNWLNIETGKPVLFEGQPLLSGYPPTYSPVRWCSCCPA